MALLLHHFPYFLDFPDSLGYLADSSTGDEEQEERRNPANPRVHRMISPMKNALTAPPRVRLFIEYAMKAIRAIPAVRIIIGSGH